MLIAIIIIICSTEDQILSMQKSSSTTQQHPALTELNLTLHLLGVCYSAVAGNMVYYMVLSAQSGGHGPQEGCCSHHPHHSEGRQPDIRMRIVYRLSACLRKALQVRFTLSDYLIHV